MEPVTITPEQLRRWKAGDPRARGEVLFESGLWTWMLQDARGDKVDATEDAMLKVEGELRRRDQAFTPRQFIQVFQVQTLRRRKDLLSKGGPDSPQATSLDEPWISGGEDAEISGSTRLERLESTREDGQPASAWRSAEVRQLTDRLLARFAEGRSGAQARHLRTLQQGIAQLRPNADAAERAACLYEFLHVDQAHREDLVDYLIEHCCRKPNTSYTHTRRLRQDWQAFVGEGGPGHDDFARLMETLRGHDG